MDWLERQSQLHRSLDFDFKIYFWARYVAVTLKK